MTDSTYTHVFLIADRSGSMQSCREATQEGINGFFAGQKDLPGKITASLFQFDNEHDVVFEHVLITDAPAYALYPRGSTALLDAVGFAFTREGEWLAAMPEDERPAHVVAVIATDGQENASTEWNAEGEDPVSRIRELVTQQRDVYGWQILFIGANIDAVNVAGTMGVSRSMSMTYRPSAAGTAGTYGAVSRSFGTLSATGFATTDWFSEADRAAAMEPDEKNPGE